MATKPSAAGSAPPPASASERTPAPHPSPQSDCLSAWERWELPVIDDGLLEPDIAIERAKPGVAAATPSLEADEPLPPPPTLEEIEAIRSAAYDEGYQEGLAEGRQAGHEAGYDAGFKAGEADQKALMTRLGQVLRVLLEPIPREDDQLETALMGLVEGITKQVVGRELLLDSSRLVAIVQQALGSLQAGNQRLRIHLNAADADIIKQALVASDDWDSQWRVQINPAVTPGGCIIETDQNLIDARAEKRLNQVIAQLYRQQAECDTAAENTHFDQLVAEVERFETDADTVAVDDAGAAVEDPLEAAQAPPASPEADVSKDASIMDGDVAHDRPADET